MHSCIESPSSPMSISYTKHCFASTTLGRGCTPLNTWPILSCVKAWAKNCQWVFIMISISQTHVYLKDYIHMHQDGKPFCGWWLVRFFVKWTRRLRPHFASLWLLPRLFNFIFYQTTSVNIWIENAENLQNRAERDVFSGVLPIWNGKNDWIIVSDVNLLSFSQFPN